MASLGSVLTPFTVTNNNDPVITQPVVVNPPNDDGKNNSPTPTTLPQGPVPTPNQPSPTPPAPNNPPLIQTRTFFTSFSTSLSTSGTVTFPVTIPVTRSTVVPVPNTNPNASNNGQTNLLTPVFWSVTAATIGAIALCAGAICFLRARVRNHRNERVYRASRNATFNSNRTFQPGMTTNSAYNSNPTKSAGYAGNVVTLVELVDSKQGSSTHSHSPPPPPMIQQQPIYAPQPTYAMHPQMTGYSQMGGSGGPPDPYGYALPQQQPMYTGGNGYGMPPTNQHQDEADGVIHFAPTVNRDMNMDEYSDLPSPPPGMAYRTSEMSGQPELFYLSEQPINPGQYAHPPVNDGGPLLDGNASGVTRRLALP